MRGEPVGAGLVEVPARDVVVERSGLGDKGGQAVVDVRLVLLERRGEVLLRDRHDGLAAAAAGDADGLGGDGGPSGGHATPGVGAAHNGGDKGAGGARGQSSISP